MQRYSNPTRRNKEDDITIFENGRRPPFFSKGRQSQFLFKWKMTSKIMQLKTMNFLGMEDNLIFFFIKEDDLKTSKSFISVCVCTCHIYMIWTERPNPKES